MMNKTILICEVKATLVDADQPVIAQRLDVTFHLADSEPQFLSDFLLARERYAILASKLAQLGVYELGSRRDFLAALEPVGRECAPKQFPRINEFHLVLPPF